MIVKSRAWLCAILLSLMFILHPARARADDLSTLKKQHRELTAANEHGAAVTVAERGLVLAEKRYGLTDIRIVTHLNDLALSYQAAGRLDDARRIRVRAFSIRRTFLRQSRLQREREIATRDRLTVEQRQRESAERDQSYATNAQSNRAAPPAPYAAPPPPGAGSGLGQDKKERPSGSASQAAPKPSPSTASGRPYAASATRTATAITLPDFPWPPPAPSTTYELPRDLFQKSVALGDVSNAILSALERSGYVERSFFRTRVDGVALVTRLERMNPDGTPAPENNRWPIGLGSDAFDLVKYLRGLFFVEEGYYRIIVFIMQDQPFVTSDQKIEAESALKWLKTGANALPGEVAARSFKDGKVTALVYEFASDGKSVRIVESAMTGKQHLERAGLLASLGRAN